MKRAFCHSSILSTFLDRSLPCPFRLASRDAIDQIDHDRDPQNPCRLVVRKSQNNATRFPHESIIAALQLQRVTREPCELLRAGTRGDDANRDHQSSRDETRFSRSGLDEREWSP